MAEESIIKYSNIIGADDTFEVLDKELDKLEARLTKLTKQAQKRASILNPNDIEGIEKLEKEVGNLVKAEKALNQQRKASAMAKKKLIDLTEEELIQREAEKIANRERVQRAKQLAIIRREEKNSIASLRAQLSLVTLEWKKLTSEESQNSDEGKKLVARKKQLTEQLKALEKQTGDNRRNVGNYTGALSKLEKVQNRVSKSVDNLRKNLTRVFIGRTIVDGVRRLGSAFGGLIDDFRESNSTIAGLGAILDKVTGAFQFAGVRILEFFAPALEKIGLLLFKLPAFFGAVAAAGTQAFRNLAAGTNKFFLAINRQFQELRKNIAFLTGEDVAKIEKNLASIDARIKANSASQRAAGEVFTETYNRILSEQKKFIAENEKAEKESENKKERERIRAEKKRQEREKQALVTQLKSLEDTRIQAIISLQNKLAQAEAENIEDRQERAIRLEELRAKAEREQLEKGFSETVSLIEQQEEALIKLYGENSEQVLAFRAETQNKLLALEATTQKLSEEQLRASEQRKNDIVADALRQRTENAVKRAQKLVKENEKNEKDFLKKQAANLKKQADEITKQEQKTAKERSERLQKQKEDINEFLGAVVQTSQQVGELIQKTFDSQARVAEESVNRQAALVEAQRQRAEAGLQNTLRFEQEQLAQKEAERARAQKKAENAAKVLALFNLVAAAAQSGDQNAVFTAIAQVAVLEGVAAALDNFYEGTEDTGTVSNPLDSKGGRLAVLHDNERVVPKKLNKQLGDMSNAELVENAIIGQNLNDYTPILANHYRSQTNQIKGESKSDSLDTSRLESKMDEVKKAILKKPVIQDDLVKATKNAATISRKVTIGAMTREYKIKTRL